MSNKSKIDHSVLFGAILSAILATAFSFVWYDNRDGFRDAGAFADLLSAFFTSAATIWLIVTVLRQGHEITLQREELVLQREELTLQRLEVKRLADEASQQSNFMLKQLNLTQREAFISEISKFIESEQKKISEIIAEMTSFINGRAIQIADIPDEGVSYNRRYGAKRVRVILRRPGHEELEVRVRYSEIASEFPNNVRLSRANGIWRRCALVGLGTWFRRDAAHAIGPFPELSVYQLMMFLSVAARIR